MMEKSAVGKFPPADNYLFDFLLQTDEQIGVEEFIDCNTQTIAQLLDCGYGRTIISSANNVVYGRLAVHPHYAISWRNNWMLQQSDYVVTYITHTWGGAAPYANKAMRQNKRTINLTELV